MGGAQSGAVRTRDLERMGIGCDGGCRGILMEKCVGSPSVETSILVDVVGWGTATRDIVT
jgi:hypothetical protein